MMIRKTLAALTLIVMGLFLAPGVASAAYVPQGEVTVTGDASPGGVVTVSFSDGVFLANESVAFTVSGEGTATLAVVRAATVNLTKQASSTGSVSVNVTLPADASGTYSVTALGLESGRVVTASITVSAAGGQSPDADGNGLADTGFGMSLAVVWGAAGIVALGAALIAVLAVTRRHHRQEDAAKSA